ncbi:MAG: DUF362 domain-containing protein [Chloroflexota bacterium]|nr:DUF362 domain-containing protein [Chloroflexota bacterium]
MTDREQGGHPPVVPIAYASGDEYGEIRSTVARALGEVTGSSEEEPLAGFLPDSVGRTIVVKPNMVRHFNPIGSLNAVVTSPVVVRAITSIAAQAVGPTGRVIVADSPQNDCDFQSLTASPGWREFRHWIDEHHANVQILDMRPEAVEMTDGVITARRSLPGDPLGESIFDMGSRSAFVGSGLDPEKLRGSDYDPEVTASSHSNGRHTYSVCRTFLDADLLIVVPKVKTHKKVGLSLAIKNLVGLVGDKNRLPHHTAGFPVSGGDEYPQRSLRSVARQWTIEKARPVLAQGRYSSFLRSLRRLEDFALPEIAERSGNWWGNDTAWRMALDLAAILRLERLERGRPTLFVYEGLVVGEGSGPLAPSSLPWGMLAGASDPVAGDLAVARELGLEPERFPVIVEAVSRRVWSEDSANVRVIRLTPSKSGRIPRLHPGWAGAPCRPQVRNA